MGIHWQEFLLNNIIPIYIFTADLEEAKLNTGKSLSKFKKIFCYQRTSSLV